MERVDLKVEVVKNRTHLNPPLEREDFLCRGRIKRNNLNAPLEIPPKSSISTSWTGLHLYELDKPHLFKLGELENGERYKIEPT